MMQECRGLGLRTVSGLGLTLVLAFLGVRPVQAAGTVPAQAWPAHVQVVEAKLAPSEFEKPSFQLALPQLRIFDREGRLLYDKTGYEPKGFADDFRRVLASDKPQGSGAPFGQEVARLITPDGKPLVEIPGTGLRIVEWWADWCAPCHAQAREMAKVLAEKPAQEVALIHVEASRPGFSGKKIVLDDSKLTDEMIKKLQDPNVSMAEKQRIIEGAQGKVEDAKPVPPPGR